MGFLEVIVLLTMTISDPWTGEELEEVVQEFRFSTTPDVCLSGSLERAHARVDYWRAHGHPYASANINCRYVYAEDGRDA